MRGYHDDSFQKQIENEIDIHFTFPNFKRVVTFVFDGTFDFGRS